MHNVFAQRRHATTQAQDTPEPQIATLGTVASLEPLSSDGTSRLVDPLIAKPKRTMEPLLTGVPGPKGATPRGPAETPCDNPHCALCWSGAAYHVCLRCHRPVCDACMTETICIRCCPVWPGLDSGRHLGPTDALVHIGLGDADAVGSTPPADC